ncbi:TPA: enoyl-CoA hydratase/isomerase family protein [Vibrio campbellii]|jgi:enoyl-CoA hydratase/carnithine racemase|uniref:enoyl-CoA hydratase/isomerase family protein n=1 Tax=Vibrio campbellii TaxID=680 RepID=UPI0005F04F9A|nr:enoyl-CoA hydratase/isomerase family protein [Vibrio campbellii]APX08940.1 enoyl-CoA hydratase [Vibrio campbellii]ARR08852.1 enoyl-CoA hydratase [Vibrio campbellii]MCE7729740.1 enoyl-CoA hydratase/isomerase family protein [Vibrio campbellii]OPH52427.1 enoyl-CoA hydratase [Vibrio campbellii]HDM8226426.1 enoyl-CoA hydratase/isomerase family protein [Vibrio campbellii]
MTGKVTISEIDCLDGVHRIGIATLDNTASLNALTYDMLAELNDQLIEWQDDPDLVCVILNGAGEKAFCAGGDVRTMYHVMHEKSKEETAEFCSNYFSLEYECDYLIHTYQKPIIGWGEGIVMGGGMGLFMGTSHRVVTPKSRLAMPEINIGLYPDVGGTWFLSQIDPEVGLFLGLTGAMVNSSDAVTIGLAEWLLLEEQYPALLEELKQVAWGSADAKSLVSALLQLMEDEVIDSKPTTQICPYLDQIKEACKGSDLNQIAQRIQAIEGGTQWLEIAQKSFASGSPITAHICFRQVKEYHRLSLADCFRLELTLSVRSALLGEFEEGVRSRLVDKDGNPKWMFNSVSEVDESVIDTLFTSLWSEEEHPLAQLGK